MKNVWILGSLVLVLLISGCTSQPKATTPGETSGLPAKTALPTETAVILPTTFTVEIDNYNFIPAQVEIAKGGTVTWNQKDPFNHTVKSAGFDSGELSQGQTFQQKFEDIGVYDYLCNIHPGMKGKIIVK